MKDRYQSITPTSWSYATGGNFARYSIVGEDYANLDNLDYPSYSFKECNRSSGSNKDFNKNIDEITQRRPMSTSGDYVMLNEVMSRKDYKDNTVAGPRNNFGWDLVYGHPGTSQTHMHCTRNNMDNYNVSLQQMQGSDYGLLTIGQPTSSKVIR